MGEGQSLKNFMLLIIWDFDGTIANSERKFKNTLHDFLEYEFNDCVIDLSLFTDDLYFKNCAGKKYTEMFRVLDELKVIDMTKVKENDLDNFLEYVTNCYKLMKTNDIVFTDGMGELIEKLDTNSSISMLIATSAHMQDFIQKRRALNNPIVNKMEAYSCCDLMDDYCHLNEETYKIKNKPNPAVFVYALEEVLKKHSDINKAIVIEDSSSGCEAGRNFKNYSFVKEKLDKIKVIGYTAGEHKPSGELLLKHGADEIAKNTKELLNIINNLL